jgi:transposase
MKQPPKPILDTFQKLKTQQSHIELREIKEHYYVYHTQCRWDKERKKPIKTTELLGSISPNGTYKLKRQKTKISTTKIYTYGNAELCLKLCEDLQNAAANMPLNKELLALSIIRALDPRPIRLAQTVWEDTSISRKIYVNLSPKHISDTLSAIGNMVKETYALFANLSPNADMLFYDLTSILSYSKKLSLAERGYNADWETVSQIKVAMAFSTSTWLPVAVDVFYGSLKETKILKYFIERFPGTELGFVMDRGFKSYPMLLDFRKQNIHYIAALNKNSKLLPSFVKMTGAFEYGEKRMIAFCKKNKSPYGFLYLFEDPTLRQEAEEFLLRQVNRGELSMDGYRLERGMAGVFGILSDLDIAPQVVYGQYKAREEIEQAFDFMKNDLEADKTCLGNDDAVRGYFVVVFLAMRLYFKILKRLRERDLVGKVSVREVLFALSKMRLIVETSGKEYLCALPKKTEQILEVFSDYIPMA